MKRQLWKIKSFITVDNHEWNDWSIRTLSTMIRNCDNCEVFMNIDWIRNMIVSLKIITSDFIIKQVIRIVENWMKLKSMKICNSVWVCPWHKKYDMQPYIL